MLNWAPHILSSVAAIAMCYVIPSISMEDTMASPQTYQVRELGVPVRSVNWVRIHPGHNQAKQPCFHVTMGQQAAGLFVLQVDAPTGQWHQFVTDVASANYPTATLMSRDGRLYIGAAYAGHLLRFDPAKQRLEDLGAISPGAASFPCRMDEDAQGRIWIGSYGSADLTCFEPQTDEFTRHGRIDDVDMYNYPLVNVDGTVACLIRMTQPHVVVFDPETGSKHTVGPVIPKGEGTLDLIRGADQSLYITSSEGNFRIDGVEAVPVDTIPAPEPAPSSEDGTQASFVDGAELLFRKLQIRRPDGQTEVFELGYDAEGSDIFYVHAGPDSRIYGSSILPLHLFRYDPETEALDDLGKCSSSGGEAYSMANLGGQLYIASYPGATVSVYDPSRAYRFGTGSEHNPRDLGRIDDISYRPRSTLTGPLGRVWTASIPDYGLWGGPLSWYDPTTEEKHAYYDICGDASCYTLAHLPDHEWLAVGTTISAGSGTQPRVTQAMLFLWDYQAEEKVWEGTLERPVSSFNALLTGLDGRLYGTVRGGKLRDQLFVFDPDAKELQGTIDLPSGPCLDLGLQNGPDGKIYGFTSECIYRVDTDSLTAEVLIQDSFGIAGPILGEDIYFATGHRLRAVRLF